MALMRNNDHALPPCVDKMRFITEAAIKLPRAMPITGHHAPPAPLVCGAIGALQAAGRTRVFGTEESSARRRSLYVAAFAFETSAISQACS